MNEYTRQCVIMSVKIIKNIEIHKSTGLKQSCPVWCCKSRCHDWNTNRKQQNSVFHLLFWLVTCHSTIDLSCWIRFQHLLTDLYRENTWNAQIMQKLVWGNSLYWLKNPKTSKATNFFCMRLTSFWKQIFPNSLLFITSVTQYKLFSQT